MSSTEELDSCTLHTFLIISDVSIQQTKIIFVSDFLLERKYLLLSVEFP
jgi:hypothetical protein